MMRQLHILVESILGYLLKLRVDFIQPGENIFIFACFMVYSPKEDMIDFRYLN